MFYFFLDYYKLILTNTNNMTLYFSLLHIQLFNSVIVGQIGTVSYSFLLCVNCAYIFKLISIGFYFTLLLCFHCTPNNALLFYLFLILLDVHNSGYLVSQVNYWPINPELLGIQPSPAQPSSAQLSPAQPSSLWTFLHKIIQ